MSNGREGIFVNGLWVEKEPLKGVPEVDEVGCTSAPLQSISFHFGAACKSYNEDYILCKKENGDPRDCLAEGRKVTRCALDFISKLKENCDESWTKHWQCLDMSNQRFQKCRKEERQLNDCIFDKLGISKNIPDYEPGQTQIHLKENPMYK
ncbi:hypothetical protein BATDEDRAFT_19994 [Batrachochytrium dendrobatidis JAM81]|uniref:NADH-ubiquinone oxidoreductase n=2 Tax=Batrachochytrium dendrobatidis TaxID=109871 RepID=F4P5Y3_BATDJ|nr:uncharacterized protein BATDEDRAFT_19994 [Batrachochytrium dendrobatidis JAM81]EGF79508.1 hypothetical protein BATDEDRAFT_19994 [Batrachochytrium dendrobatidis JAM81]KAJ8322870.1 ndufa8, NADH-ubiquinone oxidoreductase complex I 19kd subunit [Batrachochytrium dendrobatidis]KAK5665814.1 ndufa8, NADH-ubiquinone oxidoreductase complex I 19kd subunit [Batrachochytrium dendrobatidis]OAJ42751.1 hypothetical protein BDEG_26166 [Batrachochytrium dendrobatidis JEL423]|eukprot:XP_006679832.1 hypothetical protein BATDEDRAFT_19994 [Batrachochytrium dendrobatidis JAM81]